MTSNKMISIEEMLLARMALDRVLARLSDAQYRKSITEAVSNTIAGKPAGKPAHAAPRVIAKVEERSDADTV